MNIFDWFFLRCNVDLIANMLIIVLACHFCGPRLDFRRYRFKWRSRRPGFDLGEFVIREYPSIYTALTDYPPTGEDLKLIRDMVCRYRWELAKHFDDGMAVADSEPRLIVRECEKLLEAWG